MADPRLCFRAGVGTPAEVAARHGKGGTRNEADGQNGVANQPDGRHRTRERAGRRRELRRPPNNHLRAKSVRRLPDRRKWDTGRSALSECGGRALARRQSRKPE